MEVATSELQNWRGCALKWGPCMPIWDLLTYTYILTDFDLKMKKWTGLRSTLFILDSRVPFRLTVHNVHYIQIWQKIGWNFVFGLFFKWFAKLEFGAKNVKKWKSITFIKFAYFHLFILLLLGTTSHQTIKWKRGSRIDDFQWVLCSSLKLFDKNFWILIILFHGSNCK